MNKKSVLLTTNNLLGKSNIKLLVNGQGVFVFSNKDNTSPISLFFYNKDKTDGLHIIFTINNIFVHKIKDNKNLIDIDNKCGLSNIKGAYYWVSIDYQNQKIYAGIGEPRLETHIYKYFLNHTINYF